ncbi:MAG: hypothetical protein ACE364_07835 [Chlorobiota bacterium]
MKLDSYSKNSQLIFIVFIILLATQYFGGYLLSGLNFAYPTDDVYSQMSIAHNIESNGIWGVMEGQFSSSSNYLLYTIMIAVHYFIGIDSIFVPLIFNIIASFGAIYAFGKCLSAAGVSSNKFMVFGILFIFALPLHYLAYLGLGYTLHIWLLLLLLSKSIVYIVKDDHKLKGIFSISILASLATLASYSTIFVLLTLAVIFLIKKQLSNAIVFGLISFSFVTLFGVYSVVSGGYFIPNEYMLIIADLKFAEQGVFYYLTNGISLLITNPETGIGLIFAIISLIYSAKTKKNEFIFWVSIITIVSYVLHSAFLPLNRLGMCEVYLTALALVCFSYLSNQIFYNKKYNFAIIIVMISYLALRTFPLVYESRFDLNNTYNLDIQVTEFINESLQEIPVVVSSPGVVSYYTDNKFFDLSMKESSQMLDHYIENGNLNEDVIAISADNISAQLAIYSEEYNLARIPREWVKLATWTLKNGRNGERSKIDFYNISFKEETLLTSLKEFESQLPEKVKVNYYIDPPGEKLQVLPFLRNGRY